MIRRPTLDQVSIMLLVTRHSWLAGAVGGGISRRPLDRACDHYDRSLHRDGSCCAGVLVAMGAGNQVTPSWTRGRSQVIQDRPRPSGGRWLATALDN